MKATRLLAVVCAAAMIFCACQKASPAPESSVASSEEPRPAPSVIAEEVAATEQTPEILVTSVTGAGQAQFQHAQDGEKMPLTSGQALAELDIITTGGDVTVVVALEEGKEVHIGENSVFALSAIRRDSNGNVNILALKQGSIVNVVDTALEDGDIYEVYTPRLVMSVRGTANYMSSGKDGDSVVGITGETHVLAGDKPFNVVQGSAVAQQEGKDPSIGPSSSSDLPDLATGFTGGRNISFDGLSDDDIARAQQTAGNYSPSTLGANVAGDFAQSLFNNPDISAPEPEPSAGQLPDDTIVSVQTPANPPINTQPASSAPSSSSKASSVSSEKSSSQNLPESSEESSRRSNSSKSSRSSSSPTVTMPTTPTTPTEPLTPETDDNNHHNHNITVTYRDSRDSGSNVGTQVIEFDTHPNHIATNQLIVPTGYFISFYGNDNEVIFGQYASVHDLTDIIHVASGHTATVYVYPLSDAPATIPVRLYGDSATIAGSYLGGDGLSIDTADLIDPSTGNAADLIQTYMDGIWSGPYYDIVGSITYDMVYIQNEVPSTDLSPHNVHEPCIWVKVAPRAN